MNIAKSLVSSDRNRRRTLATALAMALVAAGAVTYVGRHQSLTEVPSISFSTEEYQPPLSTVHVPVEIDLAALEAVLNTEAPTSFMHEWKDSVRLEETVSFDYPCVRKFYKIYRCTKKVRVATPPVPYQGDARVTRPGKIELVGHGDELEVRVPLAFWVRISGRGSLGSKIHETAEGRFVLSTRVRATLDSDWNLRFGAAPTIEWQGEPGGKLFNSVDYTIKSLVQEKLEDGIEEMVARLEQDAGKQLKMREHAQETWTAAFDAHAIPGELPTWAVVAPESVAWSPLAFNDGKMTSALQFSLVTMVVVGGEAPPAPIPTPLPALEVVNEANNEGELRIHAPVRVSYASVSDLALSMAADATELSEAGITVSDIDFYPAGDRLAVRVVAAVDVPGKWLDTNVILHLAGKPTLDTVSNTFSLERLSLTRTLDNPLIDAIEVPLHGLIEKALAAKLQANVGPLVNDANLRMADALAPLSADGATVSVSIDSVALGEVRLMEGAMVVPVEVVGRAGASIDPSQVASR